MKPVQPVRNALGLEFGSAARQSKRPSSVWNCLWGHALKRSPGINRKSRVSYPGPGFLSSATLPSLSNKHYNGLNQTKNQILLHWCVIEFFFFGVDSDVTALIWIAYNSVWCVKTLLSVVPLKEVNMVYVCVY